VSPKTKGKEAMHNPQPAIPATAVNKFQRRPKFPMLQDRNQTTKRNVTFTAAAMFHRYLPALLLTSCSLILPCAVSAQVTPTLTHDAYIDSAQTSSNFGSQATLKAGILYNNNGSIAGYQRTLVKFDLSSVAGVPSHYILAATLKLYVTKLQPYQSNASVSLQSGALYAQNPNQPFPSFWDESSVNWQNQPPWFDYFFGPFLVAAANQTVAVDVTQYVRNVAAGRQNNGLLIFEYGAGTVVFASKESGGNAPRLEIYLNRISSVTGTGGLAGGGTNGDLALSIAD